MTSFSNYFLKRSENTFVRLTDDDPEPYHALTTVFDSPGCLPMLQKLKLRFADEKPIHLNDLSIKSYLSAPNHINICNPHFGDIYRVFVDTSAMNFLSRNLAYTLEMHSIGNIVGFFEKQRENEAKEVIEWPIMEGFTNIQEFEKFLKYADHRNRYHIDERTLETARKIQIRYKTRNFDPFSCSINVFTKRERQFLESLRWLRQLPEFEALRKYVEETQLSDDIFENFTNFDIIDGRLRVKDPEKLKVFIPHVKLLLKIYPKFAESARAIITDQKLRSKIFAYETKVCLNQFVNDLLDFDSTKLDLEKLLEKQFVHVTMTTGKAQFGLSMIHKLFQKSSLKIKYNEGAVLVLDMKRFSIVNELVNIKTFLDSTRGENFLLMLVADKFENSKTFERLSFENLFEAMKLHRNFKVVVCGEAGDECFEDLGTEAKENLSDELVELTAVDFLWKELLQESRDKILSRSVNFQGTDVNLKTFFDLKPSLEVDQLALLQLLTEKTLTINSDPLRSFDFSVYTADNGKKEIKPKIFLERLEKSDDLFVISGLYDEDPEIVKARLFKILKVEEKKIKDLIERNLSFGGDAINENAGRMNIISLVGSEACLKDFDRKCRDLLTRSSRRLVHWIKIKEDKLTWRKTYNFNGAIKQKLLKNSRSVTEKQIFNEKAAAVVGVKGQGKTSLLTHLSKELHKQSWIIHLRMNELSLKSLEQLNHESLAKFIVEVAKYDSDNHLQRFLLNHLLNSDSTCPIHFLVDGFDQVLNEKTRSNALKLFAFIKSLPNSRLILVTGDAKVFGELQPAVYTFEKLNREEKQNLLKQFYIPRFSLIWGSEKCNEIFSDKKSNFGGFAKILFDHLDQLIDENAETMIGIPQQLQLIAYGFQDDFEKYVTWKQKIIESLGIQSFYQQYIKSKYELYVTATVQMTSMDKKGKGFLNAVQSVTLDSLVPQSVKDLVSKSELFSPDYIVLQLTKGQSPPKVLSTLTGYLLTDPKLANVRDYLNCHPEFLPKTAAFEISDDTVKAIVGQPMITAAQEKRAKILDFLIEILKKKNDLKDVALQKGKSNQTALEISLEMGNETCVKSMIEFLSEFGDKRALFDQLQQNHENLIKMLEKSEDRNFVEWIADLITNNKL